MDMKLRHEKAKKRNMTEIYVLNLVSSNKQSCRINFPPFKIDFQGQSPKPLGHKVNVESKTE